MARLALDLQFGEDIVVVNKPAGISTHSPDLGKLGMAELVQLELASRGISKKIHVVHRLDKTTTGTLLFATNESATAKIFELFKNHQVKKKYHFITDYKADFEEAEVFSRIEKINNSYVSKKCEEKEANAHTFFQKIKLNAQFQLWLATPTSGKPHQIRLHAKDLGIPILGDLLYGGSPYPHLCLHALSLEIPGFGQWQSHPPIFFERLGLVRDAQLVEILSSLDMRERLYHFLTLPAQALRLQHLENSKFRMDAFGEVLWVYWYAEHDPTAHDLERFEFIGQLTKKKVLIRKMQNRGADPLSQIDFTFEDIPETWQAQENDLTYELRKSQGLSPGLFLDQRENRHWLLQNAKDQKILNLFSYTGGFSLCAAKGDAKEVVTVDLSKNFIDWSKKNFSLNNLSPTDDRSQFFVMDSVRFLQGTIKKNRKFNIIICDPPSFSRNGKDVFKIEKDYRTLLDLCWQCLEKNGVLLFCTNYEKWTHLQFEEALLQHLGPKAEKINPKFLPNLDYERPNEERLMKSLFIKRLSS